LTTYVTEQGHETQEHRSRIWNAHLKEVKLNLRSDSPLTNYTIQKKIKKKINEQR